MKKSLSVVLMLSIAVLSMLCGCGNNENKSVAQTALVDYSKDMQIMYYTGGVAVPMTKSDKGYYYVGEDRIIIFVDGKTQKATPLCSKPDCMHTNPETCDAYVNISEDISINTLFGSLGTVIQYYDGSLYMLCGEYDKSMIKYQTYLMKMNEDGTNRQKVTDYFNNTFVDWFIHQGYFYYTTDSSILRIPLSSPKSAPETVYKAKYFVKDNQNTYDSLRAYKNYLYFEVDELDEEGNGGGIQSFCINLDTMKSSPLKIGENNAYFSAFAGNSMILFYFNGNEKVYIKTDLEGNNGEKILTQKPDEMESVTSDGTYYYFNNSALATGNRSIEQIITVCDENMKKVDSFKLPEIDLAVYNFFAPQDEKYFLFEYFNEKDEHMLVMADKSQIGKIGGKTIEYKELCKLKWTEKQSSGNYIS